MYRHICVSVGSMYTYILLCHKNVYIHTPLICIYYYLLSDLKRLLVRFHTWWCAYIYTPHVYSYHFFESVILSGYPVGRFRRCKYSTIYMHVCCNSLSNWCRSSRKSRRYNRPCKPSTRRKSSRTNHISGFPRQASNAHESESADLSRGRSSYTWSRKNSSFILLF